MFGYALTKNVDADFFALWLEQNKDAPYVQNKLIFAMPNATDADACARETKSARSASR